MDSPAVYILEASPGSRIKIFPIIMKGEIS
jgi:hypothetical protein